jgi:hypothetical protein
VGRGGFTFQFPKKAKKGDEKKGTDLFWQKRGEEKAKKGTAKKGTDLFSFSKKRRKNKSVPFFRLFLALFSIHR